MSKHRKTPRASAQRTIKQNRAQQHNIDLTLETRSFAIALKVIRIRQGLSLQDLADRAKVSKSMISKIERADVLPSLAVAIRLATGLNSTLGMMLQWDQYKTPHLTRRSEQGVIANDGWERRVISPSFKADSLELIHGRLEPLANTSGSPPHPPGSEEYLTVLKGHLRFSSGDKSLLLEPGDGLFFEGDQPCKLENLGDDEAEYMVVITYRG